MKKYICLILMLLLITGCTFKGEYKVDIKKNKEVNLGITIAFDDQLLDYFISLDENAEQNYTDEQRWKVIEEIINQENGENPADYGYVSTKYEDDEFKGMTYTKTFSSIDNLVSNDANFNFEDFANTKDIKLFTNNNGMYSLKLFYENIGDELEISSYMDFKFIVTLPNKSINNNATSVSEDGKTLTWDITKMESKYFILDFKINTIPWNYIYIGGSLLLVIIFLLIASSYIKKKGKIDVSRMPNKVNSNLNNLDNSQNFNNNIVNHNNMLNQGVNKKETIETLNIDEKIIDSLNMPVGNNEEEVVNLAMVESYKSTEAPIKKEEPTTELFSFDNQNNEVNNQETTQDNIQNNK